MTKHPRRDIAASVRQRLLNHARETGRPFSELLQYFAMERFLYRLSKSGYADMKSGTLLTMLNNSIHQSNERTRGVATIQQIGQPVICNGDLKKIIGRKVPGLT